MSPGQFILFVFGNDCHLARIVLFFTHDLAVSNSHENLSKYYQGEWRRGCKGVCNGLASYLEVTILLEASCHKTRDQHQQDMSPQISKVQPLIAKFMLYAPFYHPPTPSLSFLSLVWHLWIGIEHHYWQSCMYQLANRFCFLHRKWWRKRRRLLKNQQNQK